MPCGVDHLVPASQDLPVPYNALTAICNECCTLSRTGLQLIGLPRLGTFALTGTNNTKPH